MSEPVEQAPRSGVLERAFAVLGAFSPDDVALPLGVLAQRASLPANTTLRLARQLVGLGALERAEDGTYSIGVRLLEYAALAPRGHGLRRVALPFMEDLLLVTRQHVQLTVREGQEAVLVERLSAHEALPVLHTVGARTPLDATGAGVLLLAYAPVAVQEEALRVFDPGRGDDTITTPAQLRRRLASVRRDGFISSEQQLPYFRAGVAAPVRDEHRDVVAAVSIVIPGGSPDLRPFDHAVQTTARAISRALQT